MNYDLTEEQRALGESVERLMRNDFSFQQRQSRVAKMTGFDSGVWRQLVDIGAAGMTIDPNRGGFGGGASEVFVVMRALGRALALEPVLPYCVLAPAVLHHAANDKQQASWLPGIAEGVMRIAWASNEAAASDPRLWTETRAEQQGAEWRLWGTKALVLHACTATHLLVTARYAGLPSDAAGVGIFMVERGAGDLTLTERTLVDDTPAATVRCDGTLAVALSTEPTQVRAAIGAAQRAGVAAICAEAVGTAETAYALTLDYLRTRKQFGRFIGENQALRHRSAEMLIRLELCRSMAMVAASAVDGLTDENPELDLARAKLIIGQHGRWICHEAIQLHGGIGMTEEYVVGHCLRRMLVLDTLFGDSDAQAAELAKLMSLASAA